MNSWVIVLTIVTLIVGVVNSVDQASSGRSLHHISHGDSLFTAIWKAVLAVSLISVLCQVNKS